MKRILKALLKTILAIVFIILEILLCIFLPNVAAGIIIGLGILTIFCVFYERSK